ncbi:MAG: single-stranded DNA-binding protein [Cryomorphaceae bacterium]|nr:single-stranded DNA-binding protein [Cryomorphaceae bacterium]
MKNRITLIGRVGQTPLLKTFDSGKKKCSFTVATNERFKNAEGEYQEETQWHSIILWGQLSTFAEAYVHQGDLCSLEGKLIYRSYTDSQGQVLTKTEIIGNDLQLLSPKSGASKPKD